jgi:hypothetical protein
MVITMLNPAETMSLLLRLSDDKDHFFPIRKAPLKSYRIYSGAAPREPLVQVTGTASKPH